jgi:hypothetical protein
VSTVCELEQASDDGFCIETAEEPLFHADSQSASIGSNQASPANKDTACAACVVVLSSPMAWSPSARQRRSWLVEQAGDYATIQFHYLRDGTNHNPTGTLITAQALNGGLDRPARNKRTVPIRAIDR